ncbi:hypothetical protein B0H13DRAFT_1985998 [Mycena leptocephala]|nr:hypothetical protein B0H13DRAFT_1985998 [Mycena leptocephala]
MVKNIKYVGPGETAREVKNVWKVNKGGGELPSGIWAGDAALVPDTGGTVPGRDEPGGDRLGLEDEDGSVVVETFARREAGGAHRGEHAHDEVAGGKVPLLLPVHGPKEDLTGRVDGDAGRPTWRGARQRGGWGGWISCGEGDSRGSRSERWRSEVGGRGRRGQ